MKLLNTNKTEEMIDIFVTFTVINSLIYSNALLVCLCIWSFDFSLPSSLDFTQYSDCDSNTGCVVCNDWTMANI